MYERKSLESLSTYSKYCTLNYARKSALNPPTLYTLLYLLKNFILSAPDIKSYDNNNPNNFCSIITSNVKRNHNNIMKLFTLIKRAPVYMIIGSATAS